jgi:hypothetical protein
MNPASIASSFTVQKISKHHYLIRGDERIRTYMKFCELKWSKTYQGWIVHEDDEVDLLRLHTEVLDNLKENQKTKKETPSKTKKETDRELYERFKRGEEITDDEDDEYEPSSDKTDDYEEDSFCVKDSTEEDSSESTKPTKKQSKKKEDKEVQKEVSDWIKSQKKSKKAIVAEPEEEAEEEEESDSEKEEEGETDPNRKREFQFYKRGILAYGMMTDKQQDKLEAVWNKYLHGWIIRKSFQEKLQKMGWVDVEDSSSEKKETPVIVHTPQVVSKKQVVKTMEAPKTFESYKNMFLVKGDLDLSAIAKMDGILLPALGGHLVSTVFRSELIELGFTDQSIPEKKESIKLSFSTGEKLELPVKNDL